MKALVFRNEIVRQVLAGMAGALRRDLYVSPLSPMRLEDVPDPRLRGPEWAVLENRLCGICGSDSKQVFLDGARDNPLTALISFPQVLGHEMIGVVKEAGAAVELPRGTRVALYCNLGCTARGLEPPCRWCANGSPSLCERFTEGSLAPGIHTGNCADVPGGFAELVPAHRSQLWPVPDDIRDERAVFADPFSVALQAVLRYPPAPDRPALVYGAGTIGLGLVAALRRLHPSLEIWAVARQRHQAAHARRLGANHALPSDPQALVAEVARLTAAPQRRPWQGTSWLASGVGAVYDSIASGETVETSLAVVDTRGRVVVVGVATPERFEWSLLYFKEVSLAGSNAFGFVEWEGRRRHCYEVYWELCRGGLDLAPLLTDRFPLAAWPDAFLRTRSHDRHPTVKVAFEFGPRS